MNSREGRSAPGAARPRCRLLVAALGALVAAALVPAGPAAAASNGKWSVFPTGAPGHHPRAFFVPVLTPGKAVADSVTVANYTASALTFNLYAADAINTPGGGLSLRRRTDVQRDIGRWIHLPVSTLAVPAHGTSVVPFTIAPPRQASPGDHVGGIVAEQTQGTPSSAGSVPITVVQAVGVRVYGRVVGPLQPRLAVSGLSLSVTSPVTAQFGGPADAHVAFSVRNPGNTVLNPVATVVLSTPLGTAARRSFTVNQLLPGSSTRYTLAFLGVNTAGHLRATVTVTSPHTGASAEVATWLVPWALLAVVVVGLALLGWLLVRRRRRRRRNAAPLAGADGAPDRTPDPQGELAGTAEHAHQQVAQVEEEDPAGQGHPDAPPGPGVGQ